MNVELVKEIISLREEFFKNDDHNALERSITLIDENFPVEIVEFHKNASEDEMRDILSEILNDKNVREYPFSCGDEEAIHFYSPRYDLIIHVCLSDKTSPTAYIEL